MRRYCLLAFLISTAPPGSAAAAQDEVPPVEYPALPASAAFAEEFAPRGWRIERRATGDLNRDGRRDLALVLRMQDSRNVIRNDERDEFGLDTNPRILALAFGAPEGGFRLALSDHRLIPRHDNPGALDPFSGEDGEFEIARGTLRLSLYRFMSAGSWDMGPTRFTFRWEDGAMRLIGFDFTNVKRNTGCLSKLSVNYLTRRAKAVLTHIGIEREQVRWRRLPVTPLLPLESVGGGLEFDAGGLLHELPSDCHGAGLAPAEEDG